MKVLTQIKNEVKQYLTGSVILPSGESYSEWRLKKRVFQYKNRYYPTGKVNELGEVEYWFDLITPRVYTEVKNIRIDSKYFMYWSVNPLADFAATYILNTNLVDYMARTDRASELNNAVEDFASDGNVLWRRTAHDYEKCDMLNTYLTNTLARTIDETDVIERFYLREHELRQRAHLYQNVEAVLRDCQSMSYRPTAEQTKATRQETPLYEIWRRTGLVSEAALREAQGRDGGDAGRFLLATIIVAGLTESEDDLDHEHILYAEELGYDKMSDVFKEAHRGAFKGKWWREGLTEMLFDAQTAYNEISNEIMRSIPWNTSAIFRSADLRTFQNVREALDRGTVLNSADLQQVQVSARITEALRMREEIMHEADTIANSYEVVRGITPASGTPLGTTQMMNENANKVFDFLRKKLAIPLRAIYRDIVLPAMIKELKGEDIIRITGSTQALDQFREMAANVWFNTNLLAIGPHDQATKQALLQEKIAELADRDPLLKNAPEIWQEVLPRLQVTIVGENYNTAEQETIFTMLNFEQDPLRRSFLLDYIYASRGIPVPPMAAEDTGTPASVSTDLLSDSQIEAALANERTGTNPMNAADIPAL